MSVQITCDYCGDEIGKLHTVQMVTLTARGDKGGPKRERWKDGYIGHYHGQCYGVVFRSILEFHKREDELETIPTATPDQIAEWKPGDEGEHALDFEPLFDCRVGQWGDGSERVMRQLRGDLAKRGLCLPNNHRVWDRGIRTLGDLRRAIEDQSLLSVSMIGPKRFEEIKTAVARLYFAESIASAEVTA
jgi:hypothetical protein